MPKKRLDASPYFTELRRKHAANRPKTELAIAIRHALTRMKNMRPYLDHGFLALDNSSAERAMRYVALGRKIICL